jgi:hypothetical protein
MVILWNGNIGVSNMNPQYNLDVTGVMRVSSNILLGSNTLDQVINNKVASVSSGAETPMLLQTTHNLIVKEPSTFRTISSYVMKHTPSNALISAKTEDAVYTIRVYDISSRSILGQGTFSNTSFEIQPITLSNMGSTVNHALELQVQGSNVVIGGYTIG